MSVNEKMTAIADAIRDKTGETEALTLDNIANSVNKVYEAGKHSEYDSIWDNIQNKGKRRWYQNFCNPNYDGYNMQLNKPKYDFLGNLYGAFCQSTTVIDTRVRLLEATNIAQLFRWATNVTTCPELNILENCRIEDAFYQATKLSDITVTGVIATNFDIKYSPLSVKSIKSIISCLKDFAEDTSNHYKYTVTFKTSAFNALEAEGETAEYKGVECAWAELIDNKKWNLVKA